jgi:hypothetical protein
MKLTGIAIALLLAVAARAADSSPGILFLHLRMTNGRVELVQQTRTPGRLKQRAPAGGAVQIELQSKTGETLWTQFIDDPASRRIEYEDPAQPGRLIAREITLTNVDFTVRVPVHPAAESAALFRGGGSAAKAARREVGRVQLQTAVTK